MRCRYAVQVIVFTGEMQVEGHRDKVGKFAEGWKSYDVKDRADVIVVLKGRKETVNYMETPRTLWDGDWKRCVVVLIFSHYLSVPICPALR